SWPQIEQGSIPANRAGSSNKPFRGIAIKHNREQTKDKAGGWRTEVAHEIIAQGGVISVQVLNEFVQVCRQKAHLDWDRVIKALQIIKELCGPAVPITIETHEAAVAISRRYGFRIYDSLILAEAGQAGCEVVYSEDLQH